MGFSILLKFWGGKVKVILMFLLIVIIIYFLYLVRIVLLPFLLGIILAYLFNPFISYMEKKGFSRRGSLLLLLIVILNIIVFSSLFLFPAVINEMQDLATSIPIIINSIQDYCDIIQDKFNRLQIPPVFKDSLNKSLHQLENYVLNIIQKTTEKIINSISLIFSLLLAPIITYYILKDIYFIRRSFIRLFPLKERKFCYQLLKEINNIFVGFVRGQIWISIVVGILGTAGLYFLKVKFYLLLGLLTGITNIIPYIGPIIGSLPAVLIACLSSPLKAVAVILLFVIIQQIESVIIAPKILSENVGLHPLTVIFSLLAGAELLGIWGLLFAIPIAGSLKVLVQFLIKHFSLFDNNQLC